MNSTAMKKSWKDFLLKSGLPLENDIKKFLDSKGCISDFEYSYIKSDENEIEKEFSYDIDAAYIKNEHFIELMIECKYRHESTLWIFTPDEFNGVEEIDPNSFIHANDYFSKIKFPFKRGLPIELGPLCSKGIEISSTGNNEKSITQAVYQLSYAFAPKVANAIEHQVLNLLSGEHIYYHIPIIVTTSRLYRLNDNVDISSIKKAKNIDEIAKEYDCLVLKNNIGIQLEKYNNSILTNLMLKLTMQQLMICNRSFTDDVNHLFSVIAKYYCPQTFLVIRHTPSNKGMSNLFKFIDRLINPPSSWKKIIEKQEAAYKKSKKYKK